VLLLDEPTAFLAMKAGRIVTQGAPAEVVTPEVVAEVFDVGCQVTTDPVSGTPLVIPTGRHHKAAVSAERP